MTTDLTMPALSPTMEYGTLARWLVRTGDHVQEGDIVAEIETDKATMEFEVSESGFIGEILIAEGTQDVAVGTALARLTDTGKVPAAAPETEIPEAEPAPAAQVAPVDSAPAQPSPSSIESRQIQHSKNIRLSPVARRLAQRFDLAPEFAEARGGGGLITRADIAALLPVEEQRPEPTIPAAPASAVASSTNLVATTPSAHAQATMTIECDICLLLRFRERLNVFQKGIDGICIPLDAIIVKIQAIAMAPIAAERGLAINIEALSPTGVSIIASPQSTGLATIAARIQDSIADEIATCSFEDHSHLGIRQSIPNCSPGHVMALNLGAHNGEPEPQNDDASKVGSAILTGVFSGPLSEAALAAEIMRNIKASIETPERLFL